MSPGPSDRRPKRPAPKLVKPNSRRAQRSMKTMNPTNAGRQIVAGDRLLEAMTLRRAGASYHEIGRQMGISFQRAYQLVQKALVEHCTLATETADQLRAVELQRIDAIILAQWPNRAEPDHARTILAASKRRADLLGLNAPTKIAQTDPSGNAIVEATVDLSALSVEDLQTLHAIYDRARPDARPTQSD